MAKKKQDKKDLIPQLIGSIARNVATIVLDEKLSLENAFQKYKKDLKPKSRMHNYDLDGAKKTILEKAEARIKGANAVISKTPEKPKETPKKPASKKPASKKTEPKTEAEPEETKQKFSKPKMVLIKGKAKLVESEEGVYIEKTDDTKMVGLKCEEGSTAKKVDENKAGCVFDNY